MPTPDDVRASLDAALAEAERAMRDAETAGVIPDDLRARHRELLDALASLRAQIEAAFG